MSDPTYQRNQAAYQARLLPVLPCAKANIIPSARSWTICWPWMYVVSHGTAKAMPLLM